MIILIKNENEIRYKITLGRVGVEKCVKLELKEFVREGFGGVGVGWVIMEMGKFFNFLNFFKKFL